MYSMKFAGILDLNVNVQNGAIEWEQQFETVIVTRAHKLLKEFKYTKPVVFAVTKS